MVSCTWENLLFCFKEKPTRLKSHHSISVFPFLFFFCYLLKNICIPSEKFQSTKRSSILANPGELAFVSIYQKVHNIIYVSGRCY